MKTVTAERKLIQKLIQMGQSVETIVEIVSVLDADQNCEKMMTELENMCNPSREALLFTAFLIANPD